MKKLLPNVVVLVTFLFYVGYHYSTLYIDVADIDVDTNKVLDLTSPLVSGQENNGRLVSSGYKHNDKYSCISRYQSALYRKESQYKPSSYLISRLRQYESLHKRCQPFTESYNETVEKLDSNKDPSDCNYLIWLPVGGLGNRILSLASAFLYALLTERVLLVYDNGGGMADLFCEPFPGATWLLPQNFPFRNRIDNLNNKSRVCYGNMIKLVGNSSSLSLSLMYLHLVHGYDDDDKLFFCDEDQIFLKNVSWVVMKSHYYFIPSLFLIKSFEKELATLFPEKETVFHFLGRYLFSPSNSVWGLITRYYEVYLARSDEKIGIQIRTDTRFLSLFYNSTRFTFQAVFDTILACSLNNNLLPKVMNINTNESLIIPKGNGKSIGVLITSLTSGYVGKIKDIYWEHSTVNGDTVTVFQPSSEMDQKTGNKMHDRKAWAEMYLLSLTDKLITSPLSTFGYVAQALGGMKPWTLHKPENGIATNPPCTRAISMEPCFHSPPSNGCNSRYGGDMVPHVRHCEDTMWGLKLVNPKVNYDD